MTGKYLKRIIDGVPTAVVVIDKNLKAVFSNSAFKNLFPFDLKRRSTKRACKKGKSTAEFFRE